MAHCNTVLSQMLKMVPRHEFEKWANTVDGRVRSTALSRLSQFVELTVGQLNGRQSLAEIVQVKDNVIRTVKMWQADKVLGDNDPDS